MVLVNDFQAPHTQKLKAALEKVFQVVLDFVHLNVMGALMSVLCIYTKSGECYGFKHLVENHVDIFMVDIDGRTPEGWYSMSMERALDVILGMATKIQDISMMQDCCDRDAVQAIQKMHREFAKANPTFCPKGVNKTRDKLENLPITVVSFDLFKLEKFRQFS